MTFACKTHATGAVVGSDKALIFPSCPSKSDPDDTETDTSGWEVGEWLEVKVNLKTTVTVITTSNAEEINNVIIWEPTHFT